MVFLSSGGSQCKVLSLTRRLAVSSLLLGLLSACGPGATPAETSSGAGGAGGSTAGSTTTVESGGGGTSQGGSGGSGGTTGAGGDSDPGDLILSVAPDSVYEARTDLKVGALGLVVVTWVGHPDGQPSYIGYAFSMDQGLTFTPPARLETPAGESADHPTLAITQQNDVYLSWLGVGAAGASDTRVHVAHAAPGQTSFDAGVEVTTPSDGLAFDRPRLALVGPESLIVVYERNGPGVEGIGASRSLDGETWTSTDLPVDPYFDSVGRRPHPCVVAGGPPGSLRVAYLGKFAGDTVEGVGTLATDDYGETWKTGLIHVASASQSAPRCVSSGQKYWLTFGYGSGVSDEDLLPVEDVSIATFITELGAELVTMTEANFQSRFLNPEIVVDPAENIHLAFYTGLGHGDPAGAYRASRADGLPIVGSGGTIVREPVTFDLSSDSPAWVGDYTGFAMRDDVLFLSYADNSSGTSHIAFHRIDLAPP